MTNTSGRAVSLIERIGTQASRLEALANAVGTVLGTNSALYEKLEQEVRVSKSILAQAQDEATAKVEETAAEPPIPAEVQKIVDILSESLKAAGIDVTVEPIAMNLRPMPKSIKDILSKL